MKKTGIFTVLFSLLVVLPVGADINFDLRKAATEGDDAKVKALIANGAEIDAKDENNYTALIWAARNGKASIVKTLLKEGADINAKNIFGGTALMLAAMEGYTATVKILLNEGADINARDKADLLISFKDPVIVKTLLDRGVDVEKYKNGVTALGWAMFNQHKALVSKR